MFDILKDAFDIIFPRTCHICGSSLDENERFVCALCHSLLPKTGYHSIKGNRFEERFEGKFSFDRGTSLYFYDKGGDLAKLVHDFKYHGYSGLAQEMGRTIARELLPTGFLKGIDIIVPVGMHFLKKWRRGYNQAEILAEGIAEIMNQSSSRIVKRIEVWDCLEMRRLHKSQTHRTEQERSRSVKNIFRIKKGYDLTGLTILLVDDICTTGSTLTAAAEAINTSTIKVRLRLLTLASTY